MSSVSVSNLCKSYGGSPAVTALSFTVEPGEILGLIGPNGAGKSSTIKMILDFIRPDSGEIRVFGGQMDQRCKDRLGYLPEEKGLYKNLTVIEQILYLAALKGMDPQTTRPRARAMLEQTGMAEAEKKRIKELSKGMSQMIQLIVTVIHNPELIILDEPFSGLDPVNTELLKRVVDDLRSEGRAIILSTHQMNQVEELCDRVLMIHHGSAVLYGDIKEAAARFRRKSVLVEIEGDLGPIPGVAETKPNRGGLELVLTEGTAPMMILDRLRERSVVINRFEIATPSLHEIFIQLVGAEHE
jgi:ABC-2 type transport system ATP-binding protein